MTKAVTLIHRHGLSAPTYHELPSYFDHKAIAAMVMAVTLINAWNRIAISSHLQFPG